MTLMDWITVRARREDKSVVFEPANISPTVACAHETMKITIIVDRDIVLYRAFLEFQVYTYAVYADDGNSIEKNY